MLNKPKRAIITSSVIIATLLSSASVLMAHASADDQAPKQVKSLQANEPINKTVRIGVNGRNDGLFKTAPYGEQGASFAGYANKYVGMNVKATRQVTTSNGLTWYAININGEEFFIDARGVTEVESPYIDDQTIDKTVVMEYTNDGLFAEAPYGVSGYVFKGYAREYKGQAVHASRMVTTKNGIKWYVVNIKGQDLFVNVKGASDYQPYDNDKQISKDVVMKGTGDGLFAGAPYTVQGSQLKGFARDFAGQVFHANRTVTTQNGVVWYVINVKGQDLFVDAQAVSDYQPYTNDQAINKDIKILNTGDGLFNNAPYGVVGSSLAGFARDFAGQVMHTNRTVTTQSGVVWYVVTIKGQDTFIDARATTDYSSPYKSDVKINQDLRIYQDGRHDGLFANAPYGISGYAFEGYANDADLSIVHASRKVVTQNDQIWYVVNVNGQDLFIDANGVVNNTSPYKTDTSLDKQMVINTTSKWDGLFANAPYGVSGSSFKGSAGDRNGTRVHAIRTVTTWNDKTWNVIELDGQQLFIDASKLKEYIAPVSKYNVGQTVLVAGNALWSFTDENIQRAQNQNVKILATHEGQRSNSNFYYDVQLSDGSIINGVIEQDLSDPSVSKFGVGDSVYISKGAIQSVGGNGDLKYWTSEKVKIVSKSALPYSNSKWRYSIKLDNGKVINNVLEQDLQRDKVWHKVDMEKTINWFENNKGKLTYDMYGSRNGADGTADCSGSVTQALYEAGASKYSYLYSTESLHDYLTANGFKLIAENPRNGWDARRGDVVIWGKRGFSEGAGGHTGIITSTEDNPNFISTCYITHGEKGTAVQEVRYNPYAERNNYPYYYVYRQAD